MALRYIAKGSTLARQSSFGVFDGAQQDQNLGAYLRREMPGRGSAQVGAKAIEQLGERPVGVVIETHSIRPQGFGLTDPELPFDGMNTMARVGYSLRSLSMTLMQIFFDPELPISQSNGSGIALSVPADSGALLNP